MSPSWLALYKILPTPVNILSRHTILRDMTWSASVVATLERIIIRLCKKTAEPIEIYHLCPRNIVLGPGIPKGTVIFGEDVCRPIIKCMRPIVKLLWQHLFYVILEMYDMSGSHEKLIGCFIYIPKRNLVGNFMKTPLSNLLTEKNCVKTTFLSNSVRPGCTKLS